MVVVPVTRRPWCRVQSFNTSPGEPPAGRAQWEWNFPPVVSVSQVKLAKIATVPVLVVSVTVTSVATCGGTSGPSRAPDVVTARKGSCPASR
jgi:hypothetical protein